MLDTGSITRPMYAYASKEMNKLRGGFPDVHYLVLYVREAHPGARTKGDNSVQEKRQNAQSACLLHHEKKEFMVDALDGHAQHALRNRHRRHGEVQGELDEGECIEERISESG